MAIRRKCFISYHHADQKYVDYFVNAFDERHHVFIARQLGAMPDDIINSSDTDYVMTRIRVNYIKDSTVTLVLGGKCTWARRYVDWELQASLRSGANTKPNGLLGIKLPSFPERWPERFNSNLLHEGQIDCYARWLAWDQVNIDNLSNAIDAAYERRVTHIKYIVNPRDQMGYNRPCE
jgi:MTH538 TIR-like domain (DUF1863)